MSASFVREALELFNDDLNAEGINKMPSSVTIKRHRKTEDLHLLAGIA